MLRFCGFELELAVESVIPAAAGGPLAYRAVDGAGGHWLIVEGPGSGEELAWLCAPASARALEQVASGRATPTDAVLHSLTGWVEVVRVVAGHAVPERRVSCSDLAGGRAGLAGLAAV